MKLNDRVEHKQFGRGKIIYIAKKSTIPYENKLPYLVEFDKTNSKLYDGRGYGSDGGKEYSCLWCGDSDLKLISEIVHSF